ncbi:hypothetical protein [Glutamicibacter arilaitensis]|uniref:hypothetical protein n=1 Tax=Glutamicibacter arilaitensis TaxID=256701 RepID=UPI003F916764
MKEIRESVRLGALTAGQSTITAVPHEDSTGWEVFVGSLKDGQRDMRAGRVVVSDEGKAAFQPAPFAAFAAGPDVLRALAEILELAEKQVNA